MKTLSLPAFKSVLYAVIGIFACFAASQLCAAAPLAGKTATSIHSASP